MQSNKNFGLHTTTMYISQYMKFNPLKAELNPICHLLALLRAHHIFHVSGLRVKRARVSSEEFRASRNMKSAKSR